MSNSNEQIVPKRTGKFVTFSEECDHHKKEYLGNAIVYPKTKVPDSLVDVVFRKNCSPMRFPQADEIIDLPISEREVIFDSKVCEPSSSRISPCHHHGRLTEDPIVTFRRTRRLASRNPKTNQMKEICKKLKRIHQLKQMDDLTALCKEKMSISTKETEKMDEDSSD